MTVLVTTTEPTENVLVAVTSTTVPSPTVTFSGVTTAGPWLAAPTPVSLTAQTDPVGMPVITPVVAGGVIVTLRTGRAVPWKEQAASNVNGRSATVPPVR